MAKILITGMSGTGKSSALLELEKRGHRIVDTDSDEWCEWVTETNPDGQPERDWVWREDRMTALLEGHRSGHLFVAGCKSNQGKFYPQFDAVILFSVPASILFERIAARDNNQYGKNPEERALIEEHIKNVEPLLRRGATAEIRTDRPLEEVVNDLLKIAAK
jgi:adenylate kinase family enzyme